MHYFTMASLSLSIGVAAIIGWVRFKKISNEYLPFLWLVWLGFFTELLSINFILARGSNVVIYNLFTITEAQLVLWQFRRWGFLRRAAWYRLAQGVLGGVWLYETFFLYTIETYNSYFIIFSSFVFVLMSIRAVNDLMFRTYSRIVKEPVFLICMGFILYFLYSALVETFWLFGLGKSSLFRVKVYEIMAYINLLTNIIFAFSVLWMPIKFRFIPQ